MMIEALWVGIGGGAGAMARYGLGRLFAGLVPFWVPTLGINVFGSFWLGALWARGSSARVYALLGTGFCGGFTTFSAFSLEVVRMWNAGQRTTAAAYILASVVFSVVAAGLGFVLARKT